MYIYIYVYIYIYIYTYIPAAQYSIDSRCAYCAVAPPECDTHDSDAPHSATSSLEPRHALPSAHRRGSQHAASASDDGARSPCCRSAHARVAMCVCMCACVRVFAHIRVYIYMYIIYMSSEHKALAAVAHTLESLCVYIYTRVFVCLCRDVCICLVFVYSCMHMCCVHVEGARRPCCRSAHSRIAVWVAVSLYI